MAGLGELSLPRHVPLAFQLFLDFYQEPSEPIGYKPCQYSKGPWATKSTDAWLLAVELGARRLEKYAVSQFVQNCAIAIDGPWQLIEERAEVGSALLRFSNHWVAWNASFSSGKPNEYLALDAAKLVVDVTRDTRDPRIFDIEHWYDTCGDNLNALCRHNPIHLHQRQQQQARQTRPPPLEWGSEQERRSG